MAFEAIRNVDLASLPRGGPEGCTDRKWPPVRMAQGSGERGLWKEEGLPSLGFSSPLGHSLPGTQGCSVPRHFCSSPTPSSPQSTWTSQLPLSQALGVVMCSVPPHLQTHQGPGFSQTRGFQNAAGHYKVNVMGSNKHFLIKHIRKYQTALYVVRMNIAYMCVSWVRYKEYLLP